MSRMASRTILCFCEGTLSLCQSALVGCTVGGATCAVGMKLENSPKFRELSVLDSALVGAWDGFKFGIYAPFQLLSKLGK